MHMYVRMYLLRFEDVQKSKLKVDHRLQSASKKIEELEGQMLLLRADKDK